MPPALRCFFLTSGVVPNEQTAQVPTYYTLDEVSNLKTEALVYVASS